LTIWVVCQLDLTAATATAATRRAAATLVAMDEKALKLGK